MPNSVTRTTSWRATAACRSGSFSGTTADGEKVGVNGCDIFTFQSDKIAVKSSYFKNRTA